jgi:anti-sigma regulatory factor (Ser/Thr protein kinase)
MTRRARTPAARHCTSISVEYTRTGDAFQSIQHVTAALALADDDVRPLLVIVDEVLTNIASHGGGPSGRVDVTLIVTPQTIALRTLDDGPPFDSSTVRRRADRPADSSPGGLGLILIQALADRVRYRRGGGTNELTVYRRLRSRRE